jgi:CRP-like cAMP-binding protein
MDLGRVPLFKGMTGCDIAGLLATAQRKATPAGSAFFQEDDEATACHLLVGGYIKLAQMGADGGQVILRFVGPGEMFGWARVLGGDTYPATAESLADSVALVWNGEAIEQAVRSYPTFAVNALAIVGARLREAQNRVRELATERVERRLARLLLRLVAPSGGTGPIEIPFPVSRETLAEAAGATLHTISRLLASWQSRGLIGGGRQRLVVLRPDAIRAIAESDEPRAT